MADVRLIDANGLKQDFAERQELDCPDGYYADCFMNDAQELSTEWWCVEDAVDAAPTIDAIPVVRCKDCKNRGTSYSCPMRKLVMPWQGAGSYEDCTEDEGYCHMGVKRDGGAEDAR